MEKKKKKDKQLYIPAETFEEAEAVLDAAVRAGEISFSPYESKIPEAALAGCKTTLDIVKAAQAYLSNRRDADVTDDEFFEELKEAPECLQERYSIEKIKRWHKRGLG